MSDIPAPLDSEYPEVAWGLKSGEAKHTPFLIPRPKVTDHAVKFEMLYCGICHSDIHLGKNEFSAVMPTSYPFVGGHELLGRVTEIGDKVTKFKVGDYCAVGCFIDSCKECHNCRKGEEQYCMNEMTGTFNGDKKHGRVGGNQVTKTFGGYSGANTVHEDYVIKIPDEMEKDKAAPLMCAGITMYSPLMYFGAGTEEKKTVGIIGVGGLGTMGIKIAKALGNDVMAISTNVKKEQIAKEKGADFFVNSKDEESVKAHMGKCDLILNTVSANHDLNVYIPLLNKGGGNLVQLGACLLPHPVCQVPLMMNRLSISGSIIGGIKETQEMVDFCFKHKIYPECQSIEAKDIDWAWDQLEKTNPDGVRFVIDIKKSLENKDFLP